MASLKSFVQTAGMLADVLKDPKRVRQALNEFDSEHSTKRKQPTSSPKRSRRFRHYYEGIHEVPEWLKTEQWITERGFQVSGPMEGSLVAMNCEQTPLYSVYKAVQRIPGADLHFNGKYYKEANHVPHYLQPLSYFQTHGLVPQGTPVAKLLVNNQFFVDYYLIPSVLNLSQRQALKADWVLHFDGDIYSCDPEQLPSSLKRKKQLEEAKLPIPEKAAAYLFAGSGFVPLYRPSDALKSKPQVPIKATTKRFDSPSCSFELTPLQKGEWWSNPERYVVLDTETTGLKAHDEIIQLAIVNLNKEVVYQQYFKPSVPSSKEAYNIHHISDEFLQDKPLWKDCWEDIKALLHDKIILIQNAKFDIEKIQQTCEKYQLHGVSVFQAKDTMAYFDQLVGVKGLKKVMMLLEIEHDDSKLHDAIEDCVKTIDSLNRTLTL